MEVAAWHCSWSDRLSSLSKLSAAEKKISWINAKWEITEECCSSSWCCIVLSLCLVCMSTATKRVDNYGHYWPRRYRSTLLNLQFPCYLTANFFCMKELHLSHRFSIYWLAPSLETVQTQSVMRKRWQKPQHKSFHCTFESSTRQSHQQCSHPWQRTLRILKGMVPKCPPPLDAL